MRHRWSALTSFQLFKYMNDNNKHIPACSEAPELWWRQQQASDWLALINRSHVTPSLASKKAPGISRPKPYKHLNQKMDYKCAKLCVISVIFVVMAQHSWSFSTVQVWKTPEQLVLPRVTCSARRLKAVFGPLVKSNIHVKGEIIIFPTSEMRWQIWLEMVSVKRVLSVVWFQNKLSIFAWNEYACFPVFFRYIRGHHPCASVWGVLWSEAGQREKPEPLPLQQIWQLLCTDWGKNKELCESYWRAEGALPDHWRPWQFFNEVARWGHGKCLGCTPKPKAITYF